MGRGGAMASRPVKKPDWRVFWPVLKDTVELSRDLQLPQAASSLAYTTILSIIPVLAVSFAVFHAFGGMERLLDTVEPFILSNLAKGTGKEVTLALRGFIANARADAVGVGGLLGLLATTMVMLTSIERAINKVWGIARQRSFFQRLSSYWLITTLGPLALAVAVGFANDEGARLSSFLPSGSSLIFLTMFLLFVVYQVAPNCKVNWRYSAFAAVVAGLAWDLAALGYEFYIRLTVSYNKIYGSLSAIPILLVWIYILWLIVLYGAALSASLQKRLEPPAEA